ncbi:MAG: alpha/beta hydrolase family protein [Gemmatimonadaceae bacterium]
MINLCLAICMASTAAAQTSECAGFIVREGANTVSIERSHRSSDTLSAQLLDVRDRRTRFAMTASIDQGALISRLDLSVWTNGALVDAPAVQSAVATFRGDSVIAESRAGGKTTTDRIGTRPGVLPYYNVVVSLLEQIVRRARKTGDMGGSPVQIPVFVLSSGGRTITATVTRTSTDSVLLALGATELRLKVDSVGRVLGGGDSRRGLVIERVPASVVDKLLVANANHAAPPGAPYVAEDVTVQSPGAPVLAGTLTHPKSPNRTPAVVLISGSGAHDRDYTGPRGYRLFWWLADTLSRRGVAVLRLDNRGVGGSTGNHDSATATDRAKDVRAAVAFLRVRPDIDSTSRRLIGISEGGISGPMLAATDTLLNGIVLMAAPAESGRAIGEYQHRFQIERDSTIPASGREAALQALVQSEDSVARHRPWLRAVLDYDPLATARRVRSTPVLILQGSTDQSVPPRDADLLATAFRAGGNRDVPVRMLPGLDHIFVKDPVGDLSRYTLFPSMRVPPDVLGVITDWTVQKLGVSAPKNNFRSNQHE